MRLLVLTQKMDRNDPVLGFFHRWMAEFSNHFDRVTVICLEEGIHDLPRNVRVFSLGKEAGVSRAEYLRRFYLYTFRMRREYDAVFVHMNQEYVLLGGLLWKLWGKRVYMWRNHHAGGILTDKAAFLCDKVFCTSKYSYTAKYPKTVLMPVGIDMEWFAPPAASAKKPGSVLFLGRVAPVKKPDLLVRAVADLVRKGANPALTIVGDPLPKDTEYAASLRSIATEEGIADLVSFVAGVPNDATRDIYAAHSVFVNLSSSGMYDKTIFEAMACGTLALASNENLRGLIDDAYVFAEGDRVELVSKLGNLLAMTSQAYAKEADKLRSLVRERHSLSMLARKLRIEMEKP
jgi:glycosyltransferase involved in cell wall biosynthesis